MLWFFLFLFGLAIGSFLNVVALRYDGTHRVFDGAVLGGRGGRSHCPHCKKTLRWFELLPVVSYAVQGGRCRNCNARIGWWYPSVELLSGIIFVAVPWRMAALYGVTAGAFVPGAAGIVSIPAGFCALTAFWILAFEILLLISYIDVRLGVIPDELNIALGALGIFVMIFEGGYFGMANQSFFGAYALLFGLQTNVWIAHIAGAIFGGALFWLIAWGSPYLFKKEGMGMGDVLFAIPLGFLFGWPDMLFLAAFGFVLGAVVGVGAIIARKKTAAGTLPFGPFLAAAAALVFFAGFQLLGWYLGIIGI